MPTKRCFLKTFFAVFSILALSASVQAKSSLWKATSPKGTLYIQGSVHFLKADNYPLAAEIENAYEQSDAVVLEADIMEMLTPETQQMIMSKAMLKGNKTLESSLTPEVYKELCKLLEDTGLPPSAVQKFKPWFVSMTVIVTKMQALGFDPGKGLDHYFYNKAKADRKKVIALETAKFQIELFETLAEGDQNAFMKWMFKDLELFESKVKELMSAWESGEAEALAKLMNESFEESPELYASFVVKRNKAWAKKIDKLTDKKTTHMVVVGAAHLPGNEGLLKLLEKKDYKLEQL